MKTDTVHVEYQTALHSILFQFVIFGKKHIFHFWLCIYYFSCEIKQ